MEFMGLAGVAAISVICWLAGEAVKLSPLEDKWIPVICGAFGGLLGLLGMRVMPEFPAGDMMSALPAPFTDPPYKSNLICKGLSTV